LVISTACFAENGKEMYQNDGARAKPSLVLRDFALIEHYFFDKIAILTKLVAKI